MVGGAGTAPFSERRAARQWAHVRAGPKPEEWARIEFIDSLCQRWGCPPSVVLHEDAALVYRIGWYAALMAEYDDPERVSAPAETESDEAMIPMEPLGA